MVPKQQNDYDRWRNSSDPHSSKAACPAFDIFYRRSTQVRYWRVVEETVRTFVCFTARSSYASAVLGSYNSVCLSVTHVLCGETKEHTADILIPHERVITLVFWQQQRLVGDVPFYLKFAPPLKSADIDKYLYLSAFQRAEDESYTLPLSPQKGGSETRIRCFASNTDILSMKLFYKVSLR